MEDGAPLHRNLFLLQWRQAHSVTKLISSTNSLNLNLIKNVWKIVKDLLHHYYRLRNKKEILQTIQSPWDRISLKSFYTFIKSMLDRMRVVILAKDGNIRW